MALRHQRPHDDFDHDHEQGAYEETQVAAVRERFGPAQAVTLIIGIFFLVLGAVGLARTGIDALDAPRVLVGPFAMSPLLALIHLGVGVLSLAASAGRAAARSMLMTLAPLMIAGGIIAWIQPSATLDYNGAAAVLYVVTGVVALVAAIVTPMLTVRTERRVTT